jgi:hypothetical protein
VIVTVVGSVALALAATGCGSDATAPSSESICPGQVEMHVSAGLTPQISWTPRCKLFAVGVEQASDGHDLWFIEADSVAGSGGISSPVTFGSVPAGTHLFDGPSPLQAGVLARAVALVPGGPTRTDTTQVVLAGFVEFTP